MTQKSNVNTDINTNTKGAEKTAESMKDQVLHYFNRPAEGIFDLIGQCILKTAIGLSPLALWFGGKALYNKFGSQQESLEDQRDNVVPMKRGA